MAVAHAPRAVVFTLEDLPAGDRQHIEAVAHRLKLPQDPASWRTPLVLTNRDAGPLAPGLRSDVDLAGGGPSLLLLAMRLLLADAWSWPEQRFIGAAETGDAGYTIYAADPARWTRETLARELLERAHAEVQKGLLPRTERSWAPGRVPVLGWQVPVLGSGPAAQLRDLRPAETRQHHFGGVALPLGVVPGHLTDRHRLFLRPLAARHDGDHGDAAIEVLRADGVSGALAAERLLLRLGPLGAPWEGEDEEALVDALRELLPGSLFCCPGGGLLLLDLHQVEIDLLDRAGGALGPVRRVALSRAALPEDEGAALLDPELWEPGALAGLLQPEECRLTPGGRLLGLRFGGRRDGVPVDAWLLLDTAAPGGCRPLLWQAELAGPAPTLALLGDESLALHGAAGLSPACLADGRPESEEGVAEWLEAHRDDLVLLGVPGAEGAGAAGPLTIRAAVPLPAPLLGVPPGKGIEPGGGPSPAALLPLRGGRALLCYQAASQAVCTVDLDEAAPRVRRTSRDDLLGLLGGEGEAALRRLLRTIADEEGEVAAEEFPALGWLAPQFAAALPREDAAALLAQAPDEAARTALGRYLDRAPLRTWDGAALAPLLD